VRQQANVEVREPQHRRQSLAARAAITSILVANTSPTPPLLLQQQPLDRHRLWLLIRGCL